MSPVPYGMPSEPAPPLSPEALRAQLDTVMQRLEQIQTTLARLDPDTYESQELRSERQELMNMRARLHTQLNPPEQHPQILEQREADRQKYEAYCKQLWAEDSPEVIAARKAEAAAARERNISFAVAEQTEHLTAFVERLTAEGDHRNARIWRMEIARLRETIERQFGK
jgi:ribosomal protein L16 Arg81 hydroxylase